VRERMRADGRVAVPLDPGSLDRAIEQLTRDRVEAVAICYLHAYRDPRHERATADAVARALPDVYVSPSCDVFPQIKEFERVSTTVVNAYVGPALSRYLYRLADRLKEAGYKGPVLIMQSHGGVAPIVEAARLAAGAVLPGPACYGKGGTAPTVTDANLVLGYLDARHFLGGRSTLDMGAAETAVDGLARELKVSRIAAAEGIHRIVNTNMAEGIRLVSVRR